MPRNTDIVLVAATGSLWGPGGERGVFKTTDGGKTWKQVLKVDDDTGANEVVMDPTNSQILYASTYQRRRTACCMNGGGPGSGIWKSTDGGETWTRIKGGVLDQPLGRISLDVYRKRPNILYATIEGPAAAAAGRGGRGNAAPAGRGPRRAGAKARPRAAPAARAAAAPRGPTPSRPASIAPTTAAPPGARSTTPTRARCTSARCASIPTTPRSSTWPASACTRRSTAAAPWPPTSPRRPTTTCMPSGSTRPTTDHVLIGNDGGLAVSYDRAQKWKFFPNLPVGLFYHVSVDNAVPYNICGGMQDNYNWCGPSQVRGSAGIAGFHWWTLLGGDGFVVLQDPADYRVAFTESQDGNIVRVDRITGETLGIRPLAAPGEPAARFHWDTPLTLSPHDPKVVYAGANRLFRSTDRGLSWTAISPDLSQEPEPRRDRDDGDEEQRHPHRQERRHRRVGNDRLVRRVGRNVPACSTPAATTATCTCRATAARTGRT